MRSAHGAAWSSLKILLLRAPREIRLHDLRVGRGINLRNLPAVLVSMQNKRQEEGLSWQWLVLRVIGSGLLFATGAVHLDLYLTGYRTIPTIGWLFLLQVICCLWPRRDRPRI